MDEYMTKDGTIANRGYSFLNSCINSDELDIFAQENFRDLILFKWKNYGRNLHMVGFFFHVIYVGILTAYTYYIYVLDTEAELKEQPKRRALELALVLGITYPALYDWLQAYQVGLRAYLSEISNYLDAVYVWGGIINVILQNGTYSQAFECKLVMAIIFLIQIPKTFHYLRLFDGVSYIVTMLSRVMIDLGPFLLFYTILIFLFANIFNVLGVGNSAIIPVPGRENKFREFVEYAESLPDFEGPEEMPGEEYEHLGLFFGSVVNVLRISLGDFDFAASEYLTASENILFWVLWALVVVLTCVVLLNFIIAEASASYDDVKGSL